MSKTFETFKFGIITDTHIRSPKGDDSSPYAVNERQMTERYAVQLLAGQNPDFVIHLGDMVHPCPTWPHMLMQQENLKKIFSPLMPNLKFVQAATTWRQTFSCFASWPD